MKVNNVRRGGWIASFVLIGAILVLGLLGGAYYLKTRAEQAAGVQAEPIATQEESGEASSNGSKETTPSSEPNSDPSESNTDNENEGVTLPSGGQSATNSTGSATSSTGSSATALPQTGPVDSLLTTSFIVLATFAAVTYLQSRKTAK